MIEDFLWEHAGWEYHVLWYFWHTIQFIKQHFVAVCSTATAIITLLITAISYCNYRRLERWRKRRA